MGRYYLNKYRPQHPKANCKGYISAHVAVAEDALGHYLPPGAEVHHVDGNPRNNAPSNLVICQDRPYHHLLHVRARVVRAGGDPNTERFCATCGQQKPLESFFRNKADQATGRHAACRECHTAYNTARKRRLRAAGMCQECGTASTRARCGECSDRYNARRRERRASV